MLPYNKPGRFVRGGPLVSGHTASVLDFDFNPFHEQVCGCRHARDLSTCPKALSSCRCRCFCHLKNVGYLVGVGLDWQRHEACVFGDGLFFPRRGHSMNLLL